MFTLRNRAARLQRRFRACFGPCMAGLVAALSPAVGVAQSSIHQATLGRLARLAEKPVGFARGLRIAVPIPLLNPTMRAMLSSTTDRAVTRGGGHPAG